MNMLGYSQEFEVSNAAYNALAFEGKFKKLIADDLATAIFNNIAIKGKDNADIELVAKMRADAKTPVTAIDVLNYAGKLRIQQEKYGMSIISHEEIANDVNEAQSSPDKESKLKATLKKVGNGLIEFLKKLMEMVNAAAAKAGSMINEFIKNRITQTALNKKTLAELVAKVESLPDQDMAGEFQDNVKTLLGGRLLSLSAVASINNVPGSEDNVKVLLDAVQHNAETASKTNNVIMEQYVNCQI
jgi:hypothetical protein